MGTSLRRILRSLLLLAALLGAGGLALGLAGALAQDRQQPAQAPAADRDQGFIARQLESLVPGLRVEGLEGTLRAAPTARAITLSDSQGVWLTLRDVRLNLAPTALLRGTLLLQALEAEFARVDRLPVADPAAPPPPQDRPAEAPTGVLPALPSLPVDVTLDRIAVGRLEIDQSVIGQAAAFSLEGQGRLESGRLAANLALRRLDREGSARIDLALAPADDLLSAEVRLEEPAGGIGPTLLGLPQYPLALDLTLNGPAAGAALSLQASAGPEVSLAAEGTVRAAPGGAFGADLAGTLRAAPLLPPEIAPVAFPARFSVAVEKPETGPLRIGRLALAAPPGEASLSGTVDLQTEAADLTLSLALEEAARLGTLLPAGIAWEALAAEARVTGTLSAPEIAFEASPRGFATGVPQADAILGSSPAIAGTASLPGPRVDVTLTGAEGRLAIAGSLDETLDVTVRLDLPRLAVLGAGSEGALEVVARAEGPRSDPTLALTARSGRIGAAGRTLEGLTLDARVEQPLSAPRAEIGLDARLDGEPVTLALRAQPEGVGADGRPARVRLDAARLRVGPATLLAEGVLALEALVFDGRASLAAPDLAPLGRLAGLEGLAGRLSAEARLEPRNATQGFAVTLEAPRIAYAGQAAQVRLSAEGTPAAFAWSTDVDAEQGALAARGRLARLDPGGWRVELAALRLAAMQPTVTLAAPAQVVLGPDGGIALGNGGLTLALPEGGRIRAAGRWGPERADLTLALSAISAALAAPFLPEVAPEGVISGQVRVTGPVGQPEIRAQLRGERLAAGAPWAAGLPPLGVTVEATGQLDGPIRAQARVEAGPAGQITATASLPRGLGAAAPLQAAVDGTLALRPLAEPFLAAGADRVEGQLQLALRAGGTLGQPVLGGRATLAGGSYRNPVLGVRISDIAGSITGQGTRLVVERLAGRTAGGGTIALQGAVDLGAPGLPTDLQLIARNARPAVSDLVTATFDADLDLEGPVFGQGAALTGEVRIQRAEIRIPNSLPASVPVLENVRVRGAPPPGAILPKGAEAPAEPGAAAPGLPPIRLDVAVTAPGRIFVRGRGADVELGGDVRVRGTLAEPVPQGGLTLRRGVLSVLARRLAFDRGSIDFDAGTLVPQLNLTAQSQAGETSITIAIQGPVTAPEVTFSSSPELPQDEVLARLLFDRPTSRLSPFEIAQIAEALAQLTGIGGGGAALDRVRGALGLDRLGIAGGGGEGAQGSGVAVEAGRYVAPGVYLGVRQGVQGGQTGVGVEVELTPRLRLEGQTATGPAGDRLGVTYEREY